MRRLLANQRGMTLVELIVALPIAALIVAGVAGMYFQLANTHVYVTDSVQCYREVQRAGAAVSRDAIQAQSVSDSNYSDEGTLQIAAAQDVGIAGTEVLSVSWTDWNDDVQTVTYSLVPVSGSSLLTLQRTAQVNGSTTESHTAAEHMDDGTDPDTLLPLTRFEWASYAKQVVRMVVTSTYGQESVTRVYEIRPRSMV